VKGEKALSLTKNVLIPYIEVQKCKNRNFHASEVVNDEWVSENTIKRKLEILKAAKVAIKCFLKYKLPFRYDPDTKMLKWSIL
jgi:hypothetical protein